MQILNNVDLKNYSTMRLGGEAKFLINIKSKADLEGALFWANSHKLPVVTIGRGANILFTDEGYRGLIMVNEIPGFETLEQDDETVTIKIGAGEDWDEVVKRTVEMGLSGIEALSAIPGSTGAAPVQNIGAYGQELADTFVELEAYDLEGKNYVTLSKEQCRFEYRDSIFKNVETRRYIIINITLKLSKLWMRPPLYRALEEYFAQNDIEELSPQNVRKAVIEIRASKLPDPKKVPNTGSFFKNPIIDEVDFKVLRTRYPEMPGYATDGKVKIPAGWLIEKAGLSHFHDKNGMGTSDKHALVVVNNSAKSFKALEEFKAKIVSTVQEKFGITLEMEPEIIKD